MWLWILAGMGALGAGVYYEKEYAPGKPHSSQSPASVAKVGSLDAALPPTTQAELIQKIGTLSASDLATLASVLALAPPPGPFPLAIALCNAQIAWLAFHQPASSTVAALAADANAGTVTASHPALQIVNSAVLAHLLVAPQNGALFPFATPSQVKVSVPSQQQVLAAKVAAAVTKYNAALSAQKTAQDVVTHDNALIQQAINNGATPASISQLTLKREGDVQKAKQATAAVTATALALQAAKQAQAA